MVLFVHQWFVHAGSVQAYSSLFDSVTTKRIEVHADGIMSLHVVNPFRL